jgi:Zn finger protein HypA/HybF involved in hydrogenase expression
MTVLSDGRLICHNCGHIVFPNDAAFRCPCPNCLEVNLSLASADYDGSLKRVGIATGSM